MKFFYDVMFWLRKEQLNEHEYESQFVSRFGLDILERSINLVFEVRAFEYTQRNPRVFLEHTKTILRALESI